MVNPPLGLAYRIFTPHFYPARRRGDPCEKPRCPELLGGTPRPYQEGATNWIGLFLGPAAAAYQGEATQPQEGQCGGLGHSGDRYAAADQQVAGVKLHESRVDAGESA